MLTYNEALQELNSCWDRLEANDMIPSLRKEVWMKRELGTRYPKLKPDTEMKEESTKALFNKINTEVTSGKFETLGLPFPQKGFADTDELLKFYRFHFRFRRMNKRNETQIASTLVLAMKALYKLIEMKPEYTSDAKPILNAWNQKTIDVDLIESEMYNFYKRRGAGKEHLNQKTGQTISKKYIAPLAFMVEVELLEQDRAISSQEFVSITNARECGFPPDGGTLEETAAYLRMNLLNQVLLSQDGSSDIIRSVPGGYILR